MKKLGIFFASNIDKAASWLYAMFWSLSSIFLYGYYNSGHAPDGVSVWLGLTMAFTVVTITLFLITQIAKRLVFLTSPKITEFKVNIVIHYVSTILLFILNVYTGQIDLPFIFCNAINLVLTAGNIYLAFYSIKLNKAGLLVPPPKKTSHSKHI